MVTLDPCERLKTIQTQLIPTILKNAHEKSPSSDIKTATEHNLPILEKNCYELAEKCIKKWPNCNEEIELCNEENIKKMFDDTRKKLEKIWEEKSKEKELE